MTDMISQDFLGLSAHPLMMKVEHRQAGAPSLIPLHGGTAGEKAKGLGGGDASAGTQGSDARADKADDASSDVKFVERLTYRDIVGFRDAVKTIDVYKRQIK